MSKTAVAPFQLNFSTQVLGEKAADHLQKHNVKQTIRSQGASIISEVIFNRLKIGDPIEVALDGNPVGTVKLASIDRVTWPKLTEDDASRGGFDTLAELRSALLRAGYRFKSLETYQFYRVQFQWI
jgi:hypothetical protein